MPEATSIFECSFTCWNVQLATSRSRDRIHWELLERLCLTNRPCATRNGRGGYGFLFLSFFLLLLLVHFLERYLKIFFAYGCIFFFACSLLYLLNNLASTMLFFCTKAFQSSSVIMPHLQNGLRPCCTYCIFNSLFQSLKDLFAVFMTHFLTWGLVPLGTLNHLIQLS